MNTIDNMTTSTSEETNTSIKPGKKTRKTYYYLHDRNKNVVGMIDKQGNRVATYEYGPYGEITHQSGPMAKENPIRYSSEFYNSNTGLIEYLYRHYNPKNGRWLQRDPIAELSGNNLYGFVRNNPVINIDRLGLAISECKEKLRQAMEQGQKEVVKKMLEDTEKMYYQDQNKRYPNSTPKPPSFDLLKGKSVEYGARICCSEGTHYTGEISRGTHNAMPALLKPCKKGKTVARVHSHHNENSWSKTDQISSLLGYPTPDQKKKGMKLENKEYEIEPGLPVGMGTPVPDNGKAPTEPGQDSDMIHRGDGQLDSGIKYDVWHRYHFPPNSGY